MHTYHSSLEIHHTQKMHTNPQKTIHYSNTAISLEGTHGEIMSQLVEKNLLAMS